MSKDVSSPNPHPASGNPGFSCDWPGSAQETEAPPRVKGRVSRYRGSGQWEGVDTVPYKDAEGRWEQVVRRVLVGRAGDETAFHLRYFEIAKGGFSTLEYHEHVHVVIGVRGLGEVRLGDELHRVGPFDVIYIGSGETHQLMNRNEEPFGFFCIVDANRDRPVPVEEEPLA